MDSSLVHQWRPIFDIIYLFYLFGSPTLIHIMKKTSNGIYIEYRNLTANKTHQVFNLVLKLVLAPQFRFNYDPYPS